MGSRRRAVNIAILLMAAVLVFLPSLCGLGPVAAVVRGWATSELPGRLEVGSCSLGWLEGLRCEQVRYLDSARGLRIEAPAVATDKGILLLIAAPSYLGEMRVEQPTLAFLPPQSAHTPSSTTSGSPADMASPPSGQTGQPPPWWEHLTIRFQVQAGQLVLERQGAPPQQLARAVELSGALTRGTVDYELNALSARQSGAVRATGFVNLPMAGQSFLKTLISRSEITVANLEIEELLTAAATRSRIPHGRGVLDAALRINIAGTDEIEAQGTVSLRKVDLWGGMLGEDRPKLDHFQWTFKGSRRPIEGWRLAAFELLSEPVKLLASGGFDGRRGSFQARGSLILPALAAQLPRLLQLHQETTITEGTSTFTLDLNGDGEVLSLGTHLVTDRLALVHAGRNYAWNTPLTLEVEAEQGQEETTLRTLRLHTPFFETHGTSVGDAFTLRGNGDLGRMSEELRTIFALKTEAKGRAELAASAGRNETGGFSLEGRVSIRDFALVRDKATIVPAHDLLLTAKADAGALFPRGEVLDSLRLDGRFWPGNFSFGAEAMRSAAVERPNCTLDASIDLERLSGAVRGFAGTASWPVARGRLLIEGAGACREGNIVFSSLRGSVDRLEVAGGGYVLREPHAVFGTESPGRLTGKPIAVGKLTIADNWQSIDGREPPTLAIDLGRRRLALHRIGYASANTLLELDGTIEDWRQPGAGNSLAVRGETDTGLLAAIARAAGWLPPDLTATGRAHGDWTSGMAPGEGERMGINLRLEPFALLRGKKTLCSDPRPMLQLSLLRAENDERRTVESLLLKTDLGRLQGTGLMTAGEPPRLELRGQITPDSKRLAALLVPVIGREAEMSGVGTGDILFSLPLSLPLEMEEVTLSAHLPMEGLRGRGIDLRRLTLPVHLNRGKLRMRLEGEMGGGRINLEPAWELAASPPVLTLHSDNLILGDVPLKPPLVDGLLSRFHGLFGAMAQPQGTIDLRVRNFSAPLTDKGPQRPTALTATLGMDRVTFKPVGALRELLALGGIEQDSFRCRQRELTCQVRSGRIDCGAVHLTAGESNVKISGDLGMDGVLRYRVGLPVNKQLAEKLHLTVPPKATVEAEISGTRTAPLFDQAAFLAGLAEQLRASTPPADAPTETGATPATTTQPADPVEQPAPFAADP